MCGIVGAVTLKPIAAFLYLTGNAGTAYGHICATCRGKGIKEKTERVVTEDEKSSTRSSLRIGVKQLVEIELQKKQEEKDRQEKKADELKKREELSHEKAESDEIRNKNQKFQRDARLEDIKKGFLNYSGKQHTFNTLPPALEKKQQAIEQIKKNEAIREEKQKATFDPNSTYSYHMLTRDITIQRLHAIMGDDAPVMKAVSQFYKSTPAVSKNIPASKQETTPKETPVE